MADEQSQAEDDNNNSQKPSSFLVDILIVGSPIIVGGVIGNILGANTLTGGAIINLGYLGMMIIGAVYLQKQASSWRQLGLAKPKSTVKTLFLGLAAFIAALFLYVLMQVVAVGILQTFAISPPAVDMTRFNPVKANPQLFGLMLFLAWTTIAFGEELFYRAFLLSRFVDHAKIGTGSAILMAGVIFGIVHFAEGPIGILANMSFGILFGWIYLRSGRNLWITIVAHGSINTFRFTLLFFGAI